MLCRLTDYRHQTNHPTKYQRSCQQTQRTNCVSPSKTARRPCACLASTGNASQSQINRKFRQRRRQPVPLKQTEDANCHCLEGSHQSSGYSCAAPRVAIGIKCQMCCARAHILRCLIERCPCPPLAVKLPVRRTCRCVRRERHAVECQCDAARIHARRCPTLCLHITHAVRQPPTYKPPGHS